MVLSFDSGLVHLLLTLFLKFLLLWTLLLECLMLRCFYTVVDIINTAFEVCDLDVVVVRL